MFLNRTWGEVTVWDKITCHIKEEQTWPNKFLQKPIGSLTCKQLWMQNFQLDESHQLTASHNFSLRVPLDPKGLTGRVQHMWALFKYSTKLEDIDVKCTRRVAVLFLSQSLALKMNQWRQQNNLNLPYVIRINVMIGTSRGFPLDPLGVLTGKRRKRKGKREIMATFIAHLLLTCK